MDMTVCIHDEFEAVEQMISRRPSEHVFIWEPLGGLIATLEDSNIWLASVGVRLGLNRHYVPSERTLWNVTVKYKLGRFPHPPWPSGPWSDTAFLYSQQNGSFVIAEHLFAERVERLLV